MTNFINTVFNPLLTWLNSIYNSLREASIPASRPMDLSQYLGPFAYMGSHWVMFITTGFSLGAIYLIIYVIMAQRGVISKFKDMIKWW